MKLSTPRTRSTPRQIHVYLSVFLLVSLCALCDLRGEIADTRVRGFNLAEQGRGASYGSESCRQELQKIKAVGGNWIAISPFAWMRSVTDPHVSVRQGRDWDEVNMAQCIAHAHELGIKVL